MTEIYSLPVLEGRILKLVVGKSVFPLKAVEKFFFTSS